eukprot:jgi/Mesvir1/13580/Mv02997-RA.1
MGVVISSQHHEHVNHSRMTITRRAVPKTYRELASGDVVVLRQNGVPFIVRRVEDQGTPGSPPVYEFVLSQPDENIRLVDPRAHLTVLRDGKWIGFRSTYAGEEMLQMLKNPQRLRFAPQFGEWEHWLVDRKVAVPNDWKPQFMHLHSRRDRSFVLPVELVMLPPVANTVPAMVREFAALVLDDIYLARQFDPMLSGHVAAVKQLEAWAAYELRMTRVDAAYARAAHGLLALVLEGWREAARASKAEREAQAASQVETHGASGDEETKSRAFGAWSKSTQKSLARKSPYADMASVTVSTLGEHLMERRLRVDGLIAAKHELIKAKRECAFLDKQRSGVSNSNAALSATGSSALPERLAPGQLSPLPRTPNKEQLGIDWAEMSLLTFVTQLVSYGLDTTPVQEAVDDLLHAVGMAPQPLLAKIDVQAVRTAGPDGASGDHPSLSLEGGKSQGAPGAQPGSAALDLSASFDLAAGGTADGNAPKTPEQVPSSGTPAGVDDAEAITAAIAREEAELAALNEALASVAAGAAALEEAAVQHIAAELAAAEARQREAEEAAAREAAAARIAAAEEAKAKVAAMEAARLAKEAQLRAEAEAAARAAEAARAAVVAKEMAEAAEAVERARAEAQAEEDARVRAAEEARNLKRVAAKKEEEAAATRLEEERKAERKRAEEVAAAASAKAKADAAAAAQKAAAAREEASPSPRAAASPGRVAIGPRSPIPTQMGEDGGVTEASITSEDLRRMTVFDFRKSLELFGLDASPILKTSDALRASMESERGYNSVRSQLENSGVDVSMLQRAMGQQLEEASLLGDSVLDGEDNSFASAADGNLSQVTAMGSALNFKEVFLSGFYKELEVRGIDASEVKKAEADMLELMQRGRGQGLFRRLSMYRFRRECQSRAFNISGLLAAQKALQMYVNRQGPTSAVHHDLAVLADMSFANVSERGSPRSMVSSVLDEDEDDLLRVDMTKLSVAGFREALEGRGLHAPHIEAVSALEKQLLQAFERELRSGKPNKHVRDMSEINSELLMNTLGAQLEASRATAPSKSPARSRGLGGNETAPIGRPRRRPSVIEDEEEEEDPLSDVDREKDARLRRIRHRRALLQRRGLR